MAVSSKYKILSPPLLLRRTFVGCRKSRPRHTRVYDSTIFGVLYFIDESNTGSIYKYVPTVKGNLGNGQTFVLRVTAYTGNVTLDYNALPSSPRVGAATWVPITDMNGTKTTVADPFQFNTSIGTGARAAADEVLGTPYATRRHCHLHR